MARHKLTRAEKIAGWKKAVRNPRTPPGLKKYMKRELAKAGIR